MSEETPRPPRPPRARPRPQPKGFDDVPVLSDEEVERRVGVRGGAAPRAPIERATRVARAPRRSERTTARDSLLLIGLVVVGLIAVRVFLPDGPLTASATSSPGASQAAVVTAGPTSPTSGSTPGLQTLVPLPTPTGGPATEVPTVAPTPAVPTPKPGQTPRPTTKPTPTPRPTAVPTPGPTPPNRATVVVYMVVVKDSGGDANAAAPNWTIHVAVEGGLTAIPNDFPGSVAGTSVSIPAGKGFTIKSNNARTDFAAFPTDSHCSKAFGGGGLAGGTSGWSCTITRDDRPRVNVEVNVNGGILAPADVLVSITDGQANPTTLQGSGQVVVGWGLSYHITASPLTDYTSSGPLDADCDGPLPLSALPVTCSFTYTYAPSPAPAVPLSLFLPLVPARRWRPTTTG